MIHAPVTPPGLTAHLHARVRPPAAPRPEPKRLPEPEPEEAVFTDPFAPLAPSGR